MDIDYINESFLKLQDIVTSIASLSHLNAILSQADPALILPSPAIGIAEFKTYRTCEIPASTIFSPLDGYSAGDDILFSLISREAMIHPWQVHSTDWITSGKTNKTDAYQFSGLHIELERDESTIAREGWLNLGILNNIIEIHDFSKIRAYANDSRLKVRKSPLSVELKNFIHPGNHSVVHNVYELNRAVIQVYIPARLVNNRKILLDLRFYEPLPSYLAREEPKVVANTCLLWNSFESEYPDIADIEQRISETQHKLIHPLINRRLGTSWRAWSLKCVYSDKERNFNPNNNALDLKYPRPEHSRLEHSLMLVPIDQDGEMITDSTYADSSGISLAIAVTPETRLYLDTRSAHLKAKYCLTGGSIANGMIEGTRLLLENENNNLDLSEIEASLSGNTWGGADGFGKCLMESYNSTSILPLLYNQPRKIRDLLIVLENYYGDHIKIVDPYDLIQQVNTLYCEPFMIRVKFTSNIGNEFEKKAILKSCEKFIRSYLGQENNILFSLIEDDNYEK